jgi:hypothetical protein
MTAVVAVAVKLGWGLGVALLATVGGAGLVGVMELVVAGVLVGWGV